MYKSKIAKPYFLFLLLALFLLGETSCKYDDGPFIAFRSRKKRVVNSWQYNLVYRNGLDVTSGAADLSVNFSNSSIGFNDDNRFTSIVNYTSLDTSYTVQYDGTWGFIEEDAKIELSYDVPVPPEGQNQVWTITRLKERVFWAQEELGENLYEYRLIPTP